MTGAARSGDPSQPDPNQADATPNWAWRSGFRPQQEFESGFLRARPTVVARALLGQRIVSAIGGRHTSGVIVETEAYLGSEDPASHAAARIGRTQRNEVMFGPAGIAYVYFIYGMHWCMNVVTGHEGTASAVLIRAVDPLDGVDSMLARRGRKPIASGPGRLCQALGVDGSYNGHDLSKPPLRLEPGWLIDSNLVARSGRIGVREAADWPLRYFVSGHPAVSR